MSTATMPATMPAKPTSPAAPARRRSTAKVKITSTAVRVALEQIAAGSPAHVDHRAGDELPARYVVAGKANCLVARVLEQLGFSLGILKALDHEHPVGELSAPGVRVAESRHPALRKVDMQAKVLLQWVQDKQDAGWAWGSIVNDAFKPKRPWEFESWDRRNRPWLYG